MTIPTRVATKRAIQRQYPGVRIDDGGDQKFLASLQGVSVEQLWERLHAYARYRAPEWKREAIRRAIKRQESEET